MSISSSTSDVQRALVVTAHPDDVDFGAGGTVAAWVQDGIEVSYCICTSGDAGGYDDTPRDRMGPLRESEQRAAAAALGVTDVRFLRYPDGRLTPSIELRRDISREIRRGRPDRVLTQSPEIWWERLGASHPDHAPPAKPRSPPSIRTRATRSRTPNCSPRASRRGRSASCG